MCLAVVDQGASARWDGSRWTVLNGNLASASYRLGDLECVTVDYCLGVQAYSNSDSPVTWSAAGWAFASPYGRPTYSEWVECPSLTTCFVTGRDGVTRSSAT
jgi:hypothetical protein